MVDRKELTRQYKETARDMGVYRVLNPRTNSAIVAASKDLTKILNRHRAQFKLRAHPTAKMQAEWNVDGGEGWIFEVLDVLPPTTDPTSDPTNDLVVLEDLWLANLGLPIDRMNTIKRR